MCIRDSNHPTAQAIVCNSGIANACTGEEGYGYCRKTAEAASAALSIPEEMCIRDRIITGITCGAGAACIRASG